MQDKKFVELLKRDFPEVKFKDGAKRFSYQLRDGVPVVFLGEPQPNFALLTLHELGHALLHMDIAKEKCLHEFDIYNMRDKTEAAANLFAAHLLIDEDQADSMLQDGYDVFHVAAVLGVSMPLLNLKLLEMSAMGYKFNNEFWGETRPFD